MRGGEEWWRNNTTAQSISSLHGSKEGCPAGAPTAEECCQPRSWPSTGPQTKYSQILMRTCPTNQLIVIHLPPPRMMETVPDVILYTPTLRQDTIHRHPWPWPSQSQWAVEVPCLTSHSLNILIPTIRGKWNHQIQIQNVKQIVLLFQIPKCTMSAWVF